MNYISFTLKQKIELYEFKERNPKESYANIGKIFGATWGKLYLGEFDIFEKRAVKLIFPWRTSKRNAKESTPTPYTI